MQQARRYSAHTLLRVTKRCGSGQANTSKNWSRKPSKTHAQARNVRPKTQAHNTTVSLCNTTPNNGTHTAHIPCHRYFHSTSRLSSLPSSPSLTALQKLVCRTACGRTLAQRLRGKGFNPTASLSYSVFRCWSSGTVCDWGCWLLLSRLRGRV